MTFFPRPAVLPAIAFALLLGACSRDEPTLPGERLAVRPAAEPLGARDPAAVPPLRLPPPQLNAAWSHRNGAPAGRLTHPALAATPSERWSIGIGEGSSRRARLLAAPIAAGGLVFTLDAAGRLSAVTQAGALAWSASLVPEGQAPDSGPGGGMAFAEGTLYATTGFGEVWALDPATGRPLWRRTLDAPVRAAPAVLDGRVFAVARNDTATALDARTGRVLWRAEGTASGTGILGGASPATEGQLVVVPFSSGELVGLVGRNGYRVWSTPVTGTRRGLVRNEINDITGDPVIEDEVVYASNQSGRTVAVDRATGEPLWTVAEGAFGPAWPAGGSAFLLSDLGALIRVDVASGAILWSEQLPQYRDPRRRRDAIAHHGPVLAGNRLWVASGDGWLRAFAPETGAPLGALPLSDGAAAPPAIAEGVMYVVTRDGRLHAFQ